MAEKDRAEKDGVEPRERRMMRGPAMGQFDIRR